MVFEGKFDLPFVLDRLAEIGLGRCGYSRQKGACTVAHLGKGVACGHTVAVGVGIGAVCLIHGLGVVQKHLRIAVQRPDMVSAAALDEVEVGSEELLEVVSGLGCAVDPLVVGGTGRFVDDVAVPDAAVVDYSRIEAGIPVDIGVGGLGADIAVGIDQVLRRTYAAGASARADRVVGLFWSASGCAADKEDRLDIVSGVVLQEIVAVVAVGGHVPRGFRARAGAEAEALVEDVLANLDHVVCGLGCIFPLLGITVGVISGAGGIEQHAGLDGKGRSLVETADLVAEVPVVNVGDGIVGCLVESHPPVEVDLVGILVDEADYVVHDLVVGSLADDAVALADDGHCAVHFQKLTVVVGLRNCGFGP